MNWRFRDFRLIQVLWLQQTELPHFYDDPARGMAVSRMQANVEDTTSVRMIARPKT